MRLLIIEDDPMVGDGLQIALKHSGYSVDWVKNGQDGITSALNDDYKLIILDMGLPEKSGMDVLKEVRGQSIDTPILILTAQDSINNRVAGLDNGADDYMIKPFALEELEARIRLLLRRKNAIKHNELMCKNIKLNMTSRTLSIENTDHALSAKEYAIFYALMEKPNAVLSRSQLEEAIYGWNEEVSSNSIEVHIHQIRHKFGKAIIKNIRGLGYCMGEIA